jgi:hypothetical protein
MPTPSAQSYSENKNIDVLAKIKICSKCHLPKTDKFFHKRAASKDGLCPTCKECSHQDYKTKYPINSESRQEYSRRYRQDENTWTVRAMRGCRRRAKESNIPFNLIASDLFPLPETCPVLGVKLDYGAGHNRKVYASIDRIIPQLGYVRGNVRVISFSANATKGSGMGDILLSTFVRILRPHPVNIHQPSLFDGL